MLSIPTNVHITEEQKKYDRLKAMLETAKSAMEDELHKALEKAEREWVEARRLTR